MEFKGKNVLITGGTKGIGKHISSSFYSHGAKVIVLGTNSKRINEINSKNDSRMIAIKCDFTNDNFIQDLSAQLNKYKKIDVLVNSAGHGPKGDILKVSDEEWIKGMEVYFLNVVRASRIITPIMQKQKNGSIINISTFAIFEPDPSFPTSGVFRSGLAAFTKIYSDKYAKDNIRMNNILPGFIDSLPTKEEFLNRIPLKRYGKVKEISAVVEMLASDGGAYITGQNIRVDGGITRSV